MTARFVLVAALGLGIAACGDNASEDAAEGAGEAIEQVDGAAEPVVGETPLVDPSESPAVEPSASASATPTPTPSATPSATRSPSPTPTPVAAAGPPEAFKQCAICHKVEPGQHGLGHSLAGVFGARAAHASGFNYSDAMESANLTWNQATLNRFLADPQAVVPGTTMAYAGEKDAAKRAALIAYLRTL